MDEKPDAQFILDLGNVDMIAEVGLNGKFVESNRKTWILRWPGKNEPLRKSGLLEPVTIVVKK